MSATRVHPVTGMPTKSEQAERMLAEDVAAGRFDPAAFWRNASLTPGCWTWNAHVLDGGYGQWAYRRLKLYAHRAAWIVTHGAIPDEARVLHACDVRACTLHLFLGSLSDNTRDAYAKTRMVSPTTAGNLRGARSPVAALTEEQVVHIRRAVISGASTAALAEELGVARWTVQSAATGKTYASVQGAAPVVFAQRGRRTIATSTADKSAGGTWGLPADLCVLSVEPCEEPKP